MKNIKPTPGYILIEQATVNQKTESGIYLPENTNADTPQKGVIIALGGKPKDSSGNEIQYPAGIGDVVIYRKWSGNEIKLDGKTCLFIKFEDVLGVEMG